MAVKGNKVLPNAHFKKDWARRVKCGFDQPMRKKRRHAKRVEKARLIAPRPTQLLRPLVRCPTARYNNRLRLGRGFTLEEIKAAGLCKERARSLGVAVDHRRRNKSVESLQLNSQRLKTYMTKLVVFPRKSAKPRKGDSSAEEIKLATQLKGVIMPYRSSKRKEARVPEVDKEGEKKMSVYEILRKARVDAKLVGVREKKAKEAQESLDAAMPKK
ncbi:RPL13 [Cordylochernes scorpioides]|uniref:60S ribosomal protein L13 n=1 Tax=Cordylochernes scorpioides TaxID=51811 RepID=A0ABY6KES5_9ARAC|nr:RPL13 [Cordylochernes scorpioides]